MKKTNFPPTISWMLLSAMVILFFMTIARFVFFYHFKTSAYSFDNSLQAFTLGLNFDLRIVSGVVLFPFLISTLHLNYVRKNRLTTGSIVRLVFTAIIMVLLLFFMKKGRMPTPSLFIMAGIFALVLAWLFATKDCNPFKNKTSQTIFKVYFFVVILALVFFYVIDFQHFDYLQQRLNAGVINFTHDAKISANMVWQTYPVFSMLLIILLSVALLYFCILLFYRAQKQKVYTGRTRSQIFLGILFTLLAGTALFGRLNQYPLRWSDAFDLEDDFRANLALNPVQSFLSTLQFRNSRYDLEKVKEYYPLMVKYLGIRNPDVDELNYQRKVRFEHTAKTPNVVVVICESFSTYKSSMWGNPLNTTPFFNEMSKQGIFFDRCFTPAFGTARGVWATITGIPDVQYPNTASRNPAYVDQHTIINDYSGYEKFYFIGGSSSWANIRGLLSNNIENLQLYEEENFVSSTVDVWGISDKRLFLEANKVFKQQTKPFFAVIQTADNHRPYTIPEEDKDQFNLVDYPQDTLQKYGFQSNAELNAFRYSDFAFKTFIDAATPESYFNNTIFVFVGDHGLKGNSGSLLPEIYNTEGINAHHVPLLFYAPHLLEAQHRNEICSQADVLPSVTALAGVSFVNTTLGRNLFDTIPKNIRFQNSAFIFDPGLKSISVLTDDYFFRHNLISDEKDFLSTNDSRIEEHASWREDREDLEKLTEAWYETARYMLHNNRKSALRK